MAMVIQGRSGLFLAFCLICLMSGLIYFKSIDAPLVLDDAGEIEENIAIRDMKNYFDLSTLLKKRPLVHLSYSINHALSGYDIRGFHITGVLIHILCSFLVFVFTRTVLSMPLASGSAKPVMIWLPLASALVFAVHPIQTQPVIYIAQRSTLLAALFYIGSVYSYLWARKHQVQKSPMILPVVLFGLCLLFTMLAFLSKQNAASLPFALVMAELVLVDRSWPGLWKKGLWILLFLGILFLAICWLAGLFAGSGNFAALIHRFDALTRETRAVSRWIYLCTQFNVIWIYLKLIVLPVGLNIDWMYPFSQGFFSGWTPIAAAGTAGLIIAGILSARKRPVVCFGIFWFFIALSVESSIIPIKDPLFEHRVYLALPGALFVILSLCLEIFKKDTYCKLMIAALTLVLATTAFQRTLVWKSELSLWTDAFDKAPHNARAANNLGLAWQRAGDPDRAAHLYRASIELNPEYAPAYSNLGKYYAMKSDFKSAEKLFQGALVLHPRFPEVLNNLGSIYATLGDVTKGLTYYKKSLQVNPNQAETHYNMGICYYRIKDPDKGLTHLKQSLYLNPGINSSIWYHIAAGYALKGDTQSMAEWLDLSMTKGFDWRPIIGSDPRFRAVKYFLK